MKFIIVWSAILSLAPSVSWAGPLAQWRQKTYKPYPNTVREAVTVLDSLYQPVLQVLPGRGKVPVFERWQAHFNVFFSRLDLSVLPKEGKRNLVIRNWMENLKKDAGYEPIYHVLRYRMMAWEHEAVSAAAEGFGGLNDHQKQIFMHELLDEAMEYYWSMEHVLTEEPSNGHESSVEYWSLRLRGIQKLSGIPAMTYEKRDKLDEAQWEARSRLIDARFSQVEAVLAGNWANRPVSGGISPRVRSETKIPASVQRLIQYLHASRDRDYDAYLIGELESKAANDYGLKKKVVFEVLRYIETNPSPAAEAFDFLKRQEIAGWHGHSSRVIEGLMNRAYDDFRRGVPDLSDQAVETAVALTVSATSPRIKAETVSLLARQSKIGNASAGYKEAWWAQAEKIVGGISLENSKAWAASRAADRPLAGDAPTETPLGYWQQLVQNVRFHPVAAFAAFVLIAGLAAALSGAGEVFGATVLSWMLFERTLAKGFTYHHAGLAIFRAVVFVGAGIYFISAVGVVPGLLLWFVAHKLAAVMANGYVPFFAKKLSEQNWQYGKGADHPGIRLVFQTLTAFVGVGAIKIGAIKFLEELAAFLWNDVATVLFRNYIGWAMSYPFLGSAAFFVGIAVVIGMVISAIPSSLRRN